jgi:hypothetical protein
VDLKEELIRQGRQYASEALTYRKRIAELALGFIKDGSVVGSIDPLAAWFLKKKGMSLSDPNSFLLQSGHANPTAGA